MGGVWGFARRRAAPPVSETRPAAHEKTPIHSTAPANVSGYHLRLRGLRTSGSVR